MADAPHSKCGGKPCRFESDHRHQSKMAGAAVFTVRPPFSSKLSKFAFGGKIDKTVGFSYNINTLNVGLEEKDCCQQSRTDFYKKSRLELGIASPRQPLGCREDNDAQEHVVTVPPFNYNMIEDWAN